MVHILRHGLPLCQFTTSLPKDWPVGDQWVSFQDTENISKATCTGCIDVHEEGKHEKHG
jgi:hypothetical protein